MVCGPSSDQLPRALFWRGIQGHSSGWENLLPQISGIALAQPFLLCSIPFCVGDSIAISHPASLPGTLTVWHLDRIVGAIDLFVLDAVTIGPRSIENSSTVPRPQTQIYAGSKASPGVMAGNRGPSARFVIPAAGPRGRFRFVQVIARWSRLQQYVVDRSWCAPSLQCDPLRYTPGSRCNPRLII